MLRLGHNYLVILTVLSALPCTSPVLYHSHLPCTQLDSKWISEPIWLNISKKHILVRRLVPAQKKSARKSHNAVPCKQTLLQLWRQPQNAVTPMHRARLHSHYNLQPSSASILPKWDLSWISVSMQCTTQQQHTHTHLHRIRNCKWGNSQVVSHRTQWMCGHKTQNSLFQLGRICNDHLVLLPPPHFRADQQLKHLKCIFQMPQTLTGMGHWPTLSAACSSAWLPNWLKTYMEL